MIDKSLNFGQRDFFFHDLVNDNPTYDYVLFVDRDGPILIGRYTKDGYNARYTLQIGDYDTILANIEDFDYVVISTLKDPRVTE